MVDVPLGKYEMQIRRLFYLDLFSSNMQENCVISLREESYKGG